MLPSDFIYSNNNFNKKKRFIADVLRKTAPNQVLPPLRLLIVLADAQYRNLTSRQTAAVKSNELRKARKRNHVHTIKRRFRPTV